ncbi:MAG: hypothetical protein P1V35_09720 [Planctomycetota bacterium]|nr:hypothetical protein [Planctomycetota bacterium]
MKNPRWISWGMLAVWSTLILTLQLVLVYRVYPGSAAKYIWMPDLTIALAVALAVRVPRSEVLPVVLVMAIVRIAFSTDPPVAILAAFLAVSLLVGGLRSGIDVAGVVPRTLLAFVCAAGMSVWGHVVLHARNRGFSSGSDFSQLLSDSMPAALMTCILVAMFGAFLAHLPGLSPLYKRPKI